MNSRIVVFALLVCGCAAEPPEEKIAKLEQLKAEQLAAIVRQKGECAAVAIEFRDDRQMLANCQETYRLVVANSTQTIKDVDTRIAQIRQCPTRGFIPDGC